MMSDINKVKSMIESLSQKIDNIMDELDAKLDKKNIDMNVDKNIYEMTHSKLMDLLDSKFNQFEQKFEGLLREPKFNKMDIYDLTPRTSTTSSGTSTCSMKHQNKSPLF